MLISTNAYISLLDLMNSHHIYRHENSKVNDLAQQASGYIVSNKNFSITKKSMCMQVQNMFLSVLDTTTGLTSSTVGLTGVPDVQTGPAVHDNPILEDSTSNNIEHEKADVVDWRRPIIDYLQDPSHKVDRMVLQLAFKFTLVEGELSRRTVDDLLLTCLYSDQAKVAMGEVNEGICGTHQSAPKMKWLLQRARFYWPTMITDCF
jgi:hypothetical protein